MPGAPCLHRATRSLPLSACRRSPGGTPIKATRLSDLWSLRPSLRKENAPAPGPPLLRVGTAPPLGSMRPRKARGKSRLGMTSCSWEWGTVPGSDHAPPWGSTGRAWPPGPVSTVPHTCSGQVSLSGASEPSPSVERALTALASSLSVSL